MGWTLLGLAVSPLRLLGRAILASPRMRRYAIRLLLLSIVLTFLACSVGVILINNVVIGRTAELGKLDTQRRELRRDNALLGAEEARLAQPSIVVKQAARKLGMVQAPELPQFIFVEPGSHQLTPYQLRTKASKPRTATTPATTPSKPATATREP
jgi:cell division protein FtsL